MPRNPTKRPDRLAEIEAQKKEIARLKSLERQYRNRR